MASLARYAEIKDEAVKAGIPVTTPETVVATWTEKDWITDETCSCLSETRKNADDYRVCLYNGAQGGIHDSKLFRSGHAEPPAHADCNCTLTRLQREKKRRIVDDSGDAAFLADMNGRTFPGPIPIQKAVEHLVDVDTYVDLVNSPLPFARNLLTRLAFDTIDMTAVPVIRDVNGCVAGRLWSRDQADAFLTLGENQQSVSSRRGWGQLKQRDIGRMRGEANAGKI